MRLFGQFLNTVMILVVQRRILNGGQDTTNLYAVSAAVAFKSILETLYPRSESDTTRLKKFGYAQQKNEGRKKKLTIVLVQDVMTCCTAHGVTTIMKSKEMAAADCEVPSEILLSANI